MSNFFKKKSNIVLISVAAVVLILVIFLWSGYNGLVEQEENIKEKHSNISVQLKKRADLIPNFVKTATAYSEYEQETFIAVTNARSAVYNASNAKEESAAAAQLDSAIDVWVNAVTEAYPEIKSDKLYINLMDGLESTESEIAYSRKTYDEAVKEYNSKVRRFPSNLIAGMFGFEEAEYFEISEADAAVPEV